MYQLQRRIIYKPVQPLQAQRVFPQCQGAFARQFTAAQAGEVFGIV